MEREPSTAQRNSDLSLSISADPYRHSQGVKRFRNLRFLPLLRSRQPGQTISISSQLGQRLRWICSWGFHSTKKRRKIHLARPENNFSFADLIQSWSPLFGRPCSHAHTHRSGDLFDCAFYALVFDKRERGHISILVPGSKIIVMYPSLGSF